MVWNIKSQKERLVKLTPDDTWGGAGLLGVTIRLDNYQGAEERLIRVLAVNPKSPAAVAGLVPEKDYLLGTTTRSLDSVQTMAELLRGHEDVVMDLYVYNSESDMVRVVALMPTMSWGGAGLLGAELGTGYLHRLPKAVIDTVGASVQRKVRYVGSTTTAGNAAAGNSGTGSAPRSGGSRSSQGQASAAFSSPPPGQKTNTHTVSMSPTDPSKGTALMEVEPQLEMEVLVDEELEDEELEEEPVRQVKPQQKEKQQQVQQKQVQKPAEAAPAKPAPAAAINNGGAGQNRNSGTTNQEQELIRPAAAVAINNGGAGQNSGINSDQEQELIRQVQQALPPPSLPHPTSPLQQEKEKVEFPQPPPPPTSGNHRGGHLSRSHSVVSRSHSVASDADDDSSLGSRSDLNGNWARLSHSTDGESSIASEQPLFGIKSPIKRTRVQVASPPSSLPGAFSSVAAIFSRPPPMGDKLSPVKSSTPAGYISTSTEGFLPPPPLMHFTTPPKSPMATSKKYSSS